MFNPSVMEIPPVPINLRLSNSTALLWQDKSCEKKLSGFVVFKQNMAALWWKQMTSRSATYALDQQCERSVRKLWLSSLYFWLFQQQMPPVKEHFQLCAEWKLIWGVLWLRREWTIWLPYMYTQKEQTLSTWKQSWTSSLQEMNDGVNFDTTA